MADLEIPEAIKQTLEDLATSAGLSLPDYLADVAAEKKREQALAVGAAAFRRVTRDSDTVRAFDDEFGGPAPSAHTPRAA
ncbi:antitoxin MazE7 [Streptomyces sp. NBC_00237]|uniref:antitoxin MazE7 n=1 Tax=Streptomyces sp. NBC_00237 TaxID=2975687 RepID=UPI002259D42F|nr:antitoxin MazE7 [Streptomyces sp. NBC_00237]MCX5206042.1 antitoxin MazE7 [Streptomyces sp. NBC_00237]